MLRLGVLFRHKFLPVSAVLLAAALSQVPDAVVARAHAVEADGKWHHEFTDEGIAVSMMMEEGRSLPAFRGVGVVEANLFEILAVLDDNKRHTDWMANCMEDKIIKQVNEFDRIMYNRTDSPWPVSDRDVVLYATVSADVEKREVISSFKSTTHPSMPPIDGVVRMPKLKGYYKLQAIDETHTRVTYQIDADVGGSLPDWLATRATRQLPVKTIATLRKQTKKMAGKYDEFIRRYDPTKGGKIPEQFAGKSAPPAPSPTPAPAPAPAQP